MPAIDTVHQQQASLINGDQGSCDCNDEQKESQEEISLAAETGLADDVPPVKKTSKEEEEWRPENMASS